MAVIIETAVVNTLVSQLINGMITLVVNPESSTDRTLDQFLRIMSTEFEHRVGSSIRAAFLDHSFVQIKAGLMSAATAFRTWRHTGFEDRTQLDLAVSEVLKARSLLLVEMDRLMLIDVDYRPKRESEVERWQAYLNERVGPQQGQEFTDIGREVVAKAVNHIQQLDSAIEAIKAVSSLDLLVLSHRARFYPGILEESIERINEYLALTTNLQKHYINSSKFTTSVKRVRIIHLKFIVGRIGNEYVEFGSDYTGCLSLNNKPVPPNVDMHILKPAEPPFQFTDPLAHINSYARFQAFIQHQELKARNTLASPNNLDCLINTLEYSRNQIYDIRREINFHREQQALEGPNQDGN